MYVNMYKSIEIFICLSTYVFLTVKCMVLHNMVWSYINKS